MRLVGDLSSARLRDELLDILAEPHVAAALERMAEIGLDRALHPHLDAGPDAVQLVRVGGARDGGAAVLARRVATLVRLACLCTRDAAPRGVRVARAAADCAGATRTWWPPR